MEARTNRLARPTAAWLTVLVAAVLWASMGASYRSANFIIETPDARFAQQVGETAEKCRHDWAIEWLGQAMPNWAQPCVMTVQVGQHLGAGGATTFVFDRGEVYGWRMSIQGSPERILDSVLPHEITHMIFASHFREPLPRWADEGGATSVEHVSEKNKQRQMLGEFLRTNRGIAFNQMFAMTEYPKDILPLYAQGYTLSELLIHSGGRRKFMAFLGDGLENNNWTAAVERYYGIKDIGLLQNAWLAWVKQGMPAIATPVAQPPAGEMLAAATARPKPATNLIYHVPNTSSTTATPLRLVPVKGPNATTVKPIEVATVQPIPAVAMQPALVLPATGWRRAGDPASVNTASYASSSPSASTSPVADGLRTEVTHPMAIEQARQTVIR